MSESVHFTGGTPHYQHVLNSLSARDRPARAKLPVRVRLVWEQDGEEWKDGHALRLDAAGPAIFVELQDKRCKFTGVWLHPDDVWWVGKWVPRTCPNFAHESPNSTPGRPR